ncbi:probable maltase-glucoamylase 2 isoform X2 [Ornithodoros turicata]|uniref:probable maltase-glucoamylase 2 isoform X2 n=1 Tax=Ornithodoros turicata TaxID=34597 RepID=UPI003139018C
MADEKWTQVAFIIAIMAGMYVYNRRATSPYDFEPPPEERIPCPTVPSMLDSKNDCEMSLCLWKESDPPFPRCFLPKNLYGYQLVDDAVPRLHGDMSSIAFNLTFNGNIYSPYVENVISTATFQLIRYGDNIVRFKISSATEARYEVPVDLELSGRTGNVVVPTYDFGVGRTTENYFTFTITRKSTGTKIIDTSIGGLVLTNQFLQFVTYVPSTEVYGLGENNHKTLRQKFDFKTFSLFARDEPSTTGRNLYGVHPFYMCLEKGGKAHGVLFLNSNAMEYTFLSAPAIRFATIGGILDFIVFIGNNPNHVLELYTSVIGRPSMPPYWALGFQLSNMNYGNLENLKKVIARNRDAEIPVDAYHLDVEYMNNYTGFTVDPVNFEGLEQFMKQETRDKGLKFVIKMVPAVLGNLKGYDVFDSGCKKEVFITWPPIIDVEQRSNPGGIDPSTDIMFGQLWRPAPVAFIDFFKNSTASWWKTHLENFRKKLPFSGVWLSMNEPSDLSRSSKARAECKVKLPDGTCWHLRCPRTIYDDPLYPTGAVTIYGPESRLRDHTLCMIARQGNDGRFLHYDVHNLYGWSQARATYRALHTLSSERVLILSRSTYPSSGRYGGHWMGDDTSRWWEMQRSIVGMLEFNMFGIPYVGANICGYRGTPTEELCLRWMQLGAFYPFSRNHKHVAPPDQDPAVFSPEAVAVMRSALQVRYSLLPFLYTLFYKAHTKGATVVRPLFHEYPNDTQTFGIDTQFMWGSSLLISPLLEERQTYMSFYIPAGMWYGWYNVSTHPSIVQVSTWC